MLKVNILLIVLFLSLLVYASAKFMTGIVGATKLNGEGCVCHSLEPSELLNVWIEGPDSVTQGETVQYKLSLVGGPAVRGGFNVASRFNFLTPLDSSVMEIDEELTHTTPKIFSSTTDTISWLFNYTALTTGWDTIYSVSNSTNGNELPTGDEWNFGKNFPVFITFPIPVELSSFTVNSNSEQVNLTWTTASEINNSGYEIQRTPHNPPFAQGGTQGGWKKIGFVKGIGTTTNSQQYSYSDFPEESGIYFYRLKQIDFNGDYEYSKILSVNFTLSTFELSQNFPNPFNPYTRINFATPVEGNFSLSIYDVKGELVEKLKEGFVKSGNHVYQWNASSYPSGVYFYEVSFQSEDGNFSDIKKMVLMK